MSKSTLQFDEAGQLIPFDDGEVTHVLSYDEKPGIQAIANTSIDFSIFAPNYTDVFGSSVASTLQTVRERLNNLENPLKPDNQRSEDMKSIFKEYVYHTFGSSFAEGTNSPISTYQKSQLNNWLAGLHGHFSRANTKNACSQNRKEGKALMEENGMEWQIHYMQNVPEVFVLIKIKKDEIRWNILKEAVLVTATQIDSLEATAMFSIITHRLCSIYSII